MCLHAKLTRKKAALLIGAEYATSQYRSVSPLVGIKDDLIRLKTHLVTYRGYSELDVKLMIEDDAVHVSMRPTKDNIVGILFLYRIVICIFILISSRYESLGT